MNLKIGSALYNINVKSQFKKDSMALLRKVVKILGLSKGTYDIRYNQAGIACSGDAILHSNTFYVLFNLDSFPWVLVRTCKGRKDYTGGVNRQFMFSDLKTKGAEGLACFIKKILDSCEILGGVGGNKVGDRKRFVEPDIDDSFEQS